MNYTLTADTMPPKMVVLEGLWPCGIAIGWVREDFILGADGKALRLVSRTRSELPVYWRLQNDVPPPLSHLRCVPTGYRLVF